MLIPAVLFSSYTHSMLSSAAVKDADSYITLQCSLSTTVWLCYTASAAAYARLLLSALIVLLERLFSALGLLPSADISAQQTVSLVAIAQLQTRKTVNVC
eukprot:13169-Heterococcus_DN1.PRE.2